MFMQDRNMLSFLARRTVNLFRGSVKDTSAYAEAYDIIARNVGRVDTFTNLDGRFLENVYSQMIDDPIVRRSLEALVETAFQPYDSGGVIRCVSKVPTLQKEIDDFLSGLPLEKLVPKMAFDLLYKGNIRAKLVYDKDDVLSYVKLLDDWKKITPFVYGGETLFYVDSEKPSDILNPWDYADAKLNTLSRYGSLDLYNIKYGSNSDDRYDNEYTPAESWLRSSVEAWRRYTLTSLSLVSARIDNLNYKKMLFLPVTSVTGKTTESYLEFFVRLFTGTRSFRSGKDGGIITSVNDFGSSRELIIPYKQDLGKPEIAEIGGQEDVTAIKDLEEHRSTLCLSLRVHAQYIGFSQEGSAGLSGESPTSRYDESFGRAVKQVQSVTLGFWSDVVLYYLLSKGYQVSKKDFTLVAVVPSSVDDEKKRISLRLSLESLQELLETIPNDYGVDKKTLMIEVFNKTVGTQIGINLFDYLTELSTDETVVSSKIYNQLLDAYLSINSNNQVPKERESCLSSYFDQRIGKFLPEFALSKNDKDRVKVVQGSNLKVSKILSTPDFYEYREDKLVLSNNDISICSDYVLDKTHLKGIGERAILLRNIVSLDKEVEAKHLVDVSKESDLIIKQCIALDDGTYGVSGRDVAVALMLKAREVPATFVKNILVK